MSDPEDDLSPAEDNLSPAEDDLEVIEEPVGAAVELKEQNGDQGQTTNEADKKEVKVKRIRNPQPKLNVDRLKGPRGLLALEAVFKDVKFKGHGSEEEDLCVLMKNYEYWCHRLFPKFPFDNCLERIERLGSKKPLQTYITKIRMGMEVESETVTNQEGDIITQEDAEDTENVNFDVIAQLQQPEVLSVAVAPPDLTAEQLQRIEINREKAQRLRKQTLIRNTGLPQVPILRTTESTLNMNVDENFDDVLNGVDLTQEFTDGGNINVPMEKTPLSTDIAKNTCNLVDVGNSIQTSESISPQCSVEPMPELDDPEAAAINKESLTSERNSLQSTDIAVFANSQTSTEQQSMSEECNETMRVVE